MFATSAHDSRQPLVLSPAAVAEEPSWTPGRRLLAELLDQCGRVGSALPRTVGAGRSALAALLAERQMVVRGRVGFSGEWVWDVVAEEPAPDVASASLDNPTSGCDEPDVASAALEQVDLALGQYVLAALERVEAAFGPLTEVAPLDADQQALEDAVARCDQATAEELLEAPPAATAPTEDEDTTHVLVRRVEGCPKRTGSASAARWALHGDSPTVAEYVRRCVAAGYTSRHAREDIRWDRAHGFVDLVLAD